MKKSLVALSAAAMVAGLGFAGAAHAIVISDVAPGGANTAVARAGIADAAAVAPVQNGGVGHIMFTPYFSTANGNTTLLSIVNTDKTYGKAVKVRFRGAANSDDILDFTVLMSPGDVWTASVEQGSDGISRLVSPDSTCVLPWQLTGKEGNDNKFRTFRLDQKLSAAALAEHTQEGYVEYLNMADILPNSAVFKAIKHVNNVAPCTESVMAMLMSTDPVTSADASGLAGADGVLRYGLSSPTGNLFGNWSIFNNNNITSYGGGHATVQAVVDAAASPLVNGAGRLFFSPQSDEAAPAAMLTVPATANTADPLLTSGVLKGLWLDLPDLSTPYVTTDASAAVRADNLSAALGSSGVMNEFVATVPGAGVPFATDWVFSQPTRRYHAAVGYTGAGNSMTSNTAVYRAGSTYYTAENMLMSHNRTSVKGTNVGSFLCTDGTFSGFNREEGNAVGDLSPAPSFGICGEVATLTFNNAPSTVLNASLTNRLVTVKQGLANRVTVEAGWATATLNAPTANAAKVMPVVGYSATSFANGQTKGNFGDAIAHRYKR